MELFHSNQPRILIADDDKSILMFYQKVLMAENKGHAAFSDATLECLASKLFGKTEFNETSHSFDLVTCSQGDEAVEAVKKSLKDNMPFAVAFLDVRMPPGPDGVWAAEQIRHLDPHIEIVIVTGYSDLHPHDIARRIPPAHKLLYIQKPFHTHELEQFAFSLAVKWNSDKELKASEKRFRALVESSPIGIFIVQKGRIVYQNPMQERFIKYIPSSLLLKDFNVHPDDIQKAKYLKASLEAESFKPASVGIRLFPADKKNRIIKWFHCRTAQIEYGGDKAVLFNMLDMTRTKELEQLAITREKMVSLGHVATGIAHEIRNPLSGITIFLDSIRESLEEIQAGEDIIELLDHAQAASDKIESVIRRVLDFSRFSNPKLKLNNINNPIEEAVNLAKVTLRKAGITLKIILGKKLPKIYIDVQLMEQVVLNLITNAAEALKSVKKNRTILIQSTSDKKNVIILVSDSGTGIPDDIKHRIFDPFFTTKNRGSGIGLNICQRIIIDHGGTINVTSLKSGGTQFKITIPREKRRMAR